MHDRVGGNLNASVAWYPGVGSGTGRIVNPVPGQVLERTPPLQRGYYRWKIRIWTDAPLIYVFQRMNADGTIQQDAPGYDHVFVRSVPNTIGEQASSKHGYSDTHDSGDDLYFMDVGAFFRILLADTSYVGGVGSPVPVNVFASLALARFDVGSPLR